MMWGDRVKELIESLFAKAGANGRTWPSSDDKTQQGPIKRLPLLALTAATLLKGTTTNAQCDQKHGPQGTTSQGARP
jgi:hypothetical protein